MEEQTAPKSRAVTRRDAHALAVAPGFSSAEGFELLQREAKALAASDMVPQQYKENTANCIIALELALRLRASPLMVMQNLYIVHGQPGWSAKFLIATFNQCGRYSTMRYAFNEGRTACRAWAIEKATGERIEGSEVSLELARAEGWSTKPGSKWRTMPEQMLMYRAATFLIRTHAPEISMGLPTEDELRDVYDLPASSVREVSEPSALQNVRDVLAQAQAIEPQPDDVGASPLDDGAEPVPASAPPEVAAQPAPARPRAPRTPRPPPASFDVETYLRRIEDCNDLAILQLMGEEVDALPESPEKELLYDALRARDFTLTS